MNETNRDAVMRTRLKQLRKENNMTLEECGKIINISRATFARWENGEITNIKLEPLSKLAKHFGVSSGWLAGFDLPKKPLTRKQQEDSNRIADMLIWCNEEQLAKIELFITQFINPKVGNKDE